MASKDETLRQLQMADLGTMRRERISTEDTEDSYRKVTIEDLEKTRLSNTDAAVKRVVEANQSYLARWNNLHKEISDNDGEALDSLMDGQSHRARLQAQIRASGGQAYVEDGNRKPSQGATNGGHGHTPEGVANSHGRKDSFQMSRSSSATSASKSQPRTARGRQASKKSSSRLDPALSESKRGIGPVNKRPPKGLRAASQPQSDVPLANPESFMESVRRQFSSTKKEPGAKPEPDAKPVPSVEIHGEDDDLMVFDTRSQPSSSPVKHKTTVSTSESEGRKGYKTTYRATELTRLANIPQPPTPTSRNSGLNGTEDLLLDFDPPSSSTLCADNPNNISDRASVVRTNSFGSALGSRGPTTSNGCFTPRGALVQPPEIRMDEEALFDYIQELSIITDSLHLFTGEKAAQLAARKEALLDIISKTKAAVSADAARSRATDSSETSSIRIETPDSGRSKPVATASTSSKAPAVNSSLKEAVNATPFVPQSTYSVQSSSGSNTDQSSVQKRAHESAQTRGAVEVATERDSMSMVTESNINTLCELLTERLTLGLGKASQTGSSQPETSHQQTTPRKGLEASRWASPSTTQSPVIRAPAPSLEQSPASKPQKKHEQELLDCTKYWQRTLYTSRKFPNEPCSADQNTRPDHEDSPKGASRGKGLLASRFAPKGD